MGAGLSGIFQQLVERHLQRSIHGQIGPTPGAGNLGIAERLIAYRTAQHRARRFQNGRWHRPRNRPNDPPELDGNPGQPAQRQRQRRAWVIRPRSRPILGKRGACFDEALIQRRVITISQPPEEGDCRSDDIQGKVDIYLSVWKVSKISF